MLITFAISLSIVTLLALIYLIRINRRINEKLLKLMAPERDARALTKRIEQGARQNYRQSEFYAQLINLLNLSAPIPPTRGWAASPDLLLTLHGVAKSNGPKTIVDLGSGMSTLILAKSAPQATIYSFDHSPEYAEKTIKVLQEHLVTNVQVRVAPLTPHSDGVDWYALDLFRDIESINLLFIDGPPGSRNPKARHPAIQELFQKLSPLAIVVIDDVSREGERLMAEEFARLLPNHSIEYLDHEKGTAILMPLSHS